jgi:site-specific DNA-methyltransferase (adenine-specific)
MWLAECYRIARPGAAIATFTDWRSLPVFSDALQIAGWTWRGVGVWVKPAGRTRPTKGGLWNDTEFILWGSKGVRTHTVYLPGTWITAAPDSRIRHHVTEKPALVLDDLVKLTPDGGHILDPFAGSGTTAVAAVRSGRRCTLVEQSSEYAQIIADRIASLAACGSDVASPPGFTGLFEGTS